MTTHVGPVDARGRSCIPFEGRPQKFQMEAAQMLFTEGSVTVQPWDWIATSCTLAYCLRIQHIIVRRPKRLSYPRDVCIYCGLFAGTRDHLLPLTMTGESARSRVLTVPACLQCNTIIGDRGTANITDRRQIAHGGLRRRYAAALRTKNWTEREMTELGPTLRDHVRRAVVRKALVLERLAWPHDPLFDFRALELTTNEQGEPRHDHGR